MDLAAEGILGVLFGLGFLMLFYGIYKELYEIKMLLKKNERL